MKPNLLDDILQEGSYPEFRDDLCVRFRSQARRRRYRQYQKLTLITALAASVVIAAMIIFSSGRRQSRVVLRNETVPTIRSEPLRAEQMLVTKPTRTEVIESRATPMITLTTRADSKTQSIDDSQLLSLFSNHPTGLIQTSAGERLVFLNPSDSERFMGSN